MNTNLTGFDHVQIVAPPDGEEAARQFYGGILGMEELPVPAALRQRVHCWFRCGTQELHVGIESDFQPLRRAHPAFVTADIQALKQDLQAHGVSITEDFALTDRQRFFAHDPWGNRLEFLQKHGSIAE